MWRLSARKSTYLTNSSRMSYLWIRGLKMLQKLKLYSHFKISGSLPGRITPVYFFLAIRCVLSIWLYLADWLSTNLTIFTCWMSISEGESTFYEHISVWTSKNYWYLGWFLPKVSWFSDTLTLKLFIYFLLKCPAH